MTTAERLRALYMKPGEQSRLATRSTLEDALPEIVALLEAWNSVMNGKPEYHVMGFVSDLESALSTALDKAGQP